MCDKIILPLPDRNLSPNARIHWTQKSKLTKAHRARAKICALEAFGCGNVYLVKSYRLLFFWPDKRRRDRDNASAFCKAYMDGISDALGQDDSEFAFKGVRFELDRENPRLEIEFDVERR